MADIKATFRFTGKASFPKNAVALLYDLEGFSRFFNQPDVQDYVPSFLNQVSSAMSVCLLGGKAVWLPKQDEYSSLSIRVVHEKFLGDGALYIIQPASDGTDFSSQNLSNLCNRLWNLQKTFRRVISSMSDDVPVFELPARIRFGLARGSVYELRKPQTGSREYIGFCINLASRLQKYCPDLGFIASARLKVPKTDLEKHGYTKVIATHLKGFPKELVIVDKREFEALEESMKTSLFETVMEA